MKIEAEAKYPVADLAAVESKLAAMGASPPARHLEADTYYAHPARDFAQTDEALRIRRIGSSSLLTYKGPKLDHATKTRREIELPLGSDDQTAARWSTLLEVLGFRPVAEVRKHRRTMLVAWQDRQVEASLDDVDEVGTFVELELLTTEADLANAHAVIASLADHLGLSASQRRSYLELLLDRRRDSP